MGQWLFSDSWFWEAWEILRHPPSAAYPRPERSRHGKPNAAGVGGMKPNGEDSTGPG